MDWTHVYENCNLCPRNCGVNREQQPGACGVGSKLRVARAALHFWEEPCISGTKGSGTVFFSGCNLGCVYCQNREISRGPLHPNGAGVERPEPVGETVSPERLTEIFFELEEQGANNINLVTGDHFLPTIAGAIEAAKKRGIGIPFLLNTSSYLNVETLRRMEGLIDIYLPDFKYIRDTDAIRYSRAPGYPEAAKAAIAEMVRQQPECCFRFEEGSSDPAQSSSDIAQISSYSAQQLLTRGVVVRHLLLPGQLIQAKLIVRYLYETYGDNIFISLMSQYTPNHEVLLEYPEIDRKVTGREYRSLIDYAAELGVTRGFMQEGEAASESFIPPFDGSGVGK